MFLHKDFMPYVIALYQQSIEEKTLPAISRAAQALIKTFDKTPELLTFINIPFIPFEEKILILERVLAKNVPILFMSFLNILGQNKKLTSVYSILNKFLEYTAHKTGVEAVTLIGAHTITHSVKNTITEILEAQLQKPIKLTIETNSEIIGGIIIKYHHHDLDLSVKNAVFSLKSALKKVYS